MLEAESAEDLVSVTNFIVGLVVLLLKYSNVLILPFELVTETNPLFTGKLVTSFLKIDVPPLFYCLIKTQGSATDYLNTLSSSPFLSMLCLLAEACLSPYTLSKEKSLRTQASF